MRPHLATFLADFRRHGKQTALVVHRGNRRLSSSWEELATLSARFAAELERRGLRTGDRVLIWGENSVEWIAAFFGCVLRGVIAVPLDAAGGVEFARRVVAEVEPKLVVGTSELIQKLEPEFEPRLDPIFEPARQSGAIDPGSSAPLLGFADFAALLPSPDYAPVAGLSRETPLQIVFTSGTTAEPKGIVHTHGNVLASLDPLEKEIGKYTRYERIFHPLRFLHTLPLSHVFGQFMGLWVPPLIAAEVHYEPRLEAGRLSRTIHENRISVLAAVPRVLDLLRAHFLGEMPELATQLASAQGLPFWRRWWRFRRVHHRLGWKFWALVCGGAALPVDLENFWTALGLALIQGYGMTETTALVTLNHPFKIAQGSIGQPLHGREIEIGPEGEILVRGAAVADRVWRHGRMEERPAGWLATGDLVTRNAHGDLVFAGRKSDVIVTSAGLNIHPQDLESALRKQPGVRDVLVVAHAGPSGPAPAAVLILDGAPGEDASSNREAEAAVAGANRDLADFQQILYSLVWPQPDFPRTSTGKPLRNRVREWAEQTFSARSSPAAPHGSLSGLLSDPLADLIRETGKISHPVADKDRLVEDLHLDSLAMVQLQSALEPSFGLEIEDSAWQNVRTVGDLRSLLKQSGTAHQASQAPLSSKDGTPAPAHSAGASGDSEDSNDRRPPARRDAKPRFPHWPWWPIVRIGRSAFLDSVMRPLVFFLLHPAIDRRNAIDRPGLLIANHVTAFDVPILLYALRRKDREHIAVAMSGELLTGWRRGSAEKHRVLNWLTPVAYWLVTALFNVFPLPRGSGLRQSFAHAGEALDRGYHVLVFPEGSRSADGRLQPFESGIGLLARDSQVPVWPVYLAGLGPLKLRKKSWFRPGTVTVRFGAPLTAEPGEEPARFALRLQAALEALAGES